MRRQVSGGAEGSRAGSVAGTEIEEEGVDEQAEEVDERAERAASPGKPASAVAAAEEPSDPFSLKATDARRALEAVSLALCCALRRQADERRPADRPATTVRRTGRQALYRRAPTSGRPRQATRARSAAGRGGRVEPRAGEDES